MSRLKLLGISSIAVAFLLPLFLIIVPFVQQRYALYAVRPQRYHYYYYSPGSNPLNLSMRPEAIYLKLIEGCFASVVFLAIGVYLLYRNFKQTAADQDSPEESQP